MTASGATGDRARVLRQGSSELVLGHDAAVLSWRSLDGALPAMVGPAAPGSVLGFLDVEPCDVPTQHGARTLLRSPSGLVEVVDELVVAAEPVGRAAPGVALVRRVRAVGAVLDVTHRVAPAGISWRPLGRAVLGYLDGRKVTVDGGVAEVVDGGVTTRLQADAGTWTALTIAVDGHLPASTVDADPYRDGC